MLHSDEACQRFLDAPQQNVLVEMMWGSVASMLHLCLNLTDLNAFMRRGEMFVVSTAQAQALMGGPFQRLLDVRSTRIKPQGLCGFPLAGPCVHTPRGCPSQVGAGDDNRDPAG